MTRLLRFSISLLASALGLAIGSPARAQYVRAGQPAGATYVDLVPDRVLSASKAGPNNVPDSLDLDADGRFDLRVAAYTNTSNFPSESEVRVLPLHDNVAIYSSSLAPLIRGFASGDTIQQRILEPIPPYAPYVWGSRSTIYPYSTSFLTRVGNNPAGIQNYGAWLGGQDEYLGVRLRASAGSAWRYGWVRLQVTALTNPVSVTIKDYALANTVLTARSATAAGWQIYPSRVAEYLTVQPPLATPGTLLLLDVCGRQQLSLPLTGTRQQLDLSALAAGVYLLRLQTAAGGFVQRIVKQ